MSVPSHGVGYGESTEELSYLIVGFGFDHKMPVVWHDDHGEDSERHDLPGFFYDSHERVVVVGFLKQSESSDRPVENVEHFVGGADSFGAWHLLILSHPHR